MRDVFGRSLSRREALRAALAAAVVPAAAALLAACGGGAAPAPSGGGGARPPQELVMGYGVDQLQTTGLDPQIHSGTVAESKLRNCYDCLVQIAKDLKTVEPQLATEWKRLDPLTMQFKLREGVKFHNGEDLDAEAVKYSIERPLKPEAKSTIRSFYANIIDRVDIVDKHTVNVVTKAPDPVLLRRLSGFNMTIIAPRWAQTVGYAGVQKEIQGTGAYRLVEWGGVGGDLVLEANDKYWGPPANVKRVRVKLIPEAATRVAALRSKDIHVTHALSPEDIDPVNKSGTHVIAKVPGNRIPFYFLEVRKPPLDDKLVRQAINYAANIDGIIQTVLQGNGGRLATLTAPWHVGFNKNLKPYPYDLEKARALLKQAGHPDGVELNIWFIQGRYVKDKEVAEAIAQELTKAGIKTTPHLNDETKQSQMDLQKQLDGLILASWGNWMFDADNVYFPLFHSSARDQSNGGKGQSSRPYGDPAFDKMLEAARVELDEEKRAAMYDKIQEYFYDQAPVLFMYHLVDIYGMDKRVKWEPRTDEMVWYREMAWA